MLSSYTILLAFNTLASSVFGSPFPPPSRRDADFNSVRTRLKHDHSGKGGDDPGKYFHESTFHPHYDGRFAEKPLPYDEKRVHLTALVQTYLSTMNDIGAETWIMHGSLLGWFWNKKIMPWDSDIDVQMSENSMTHLADYYNMTVHHFKLPGVPKGRDYMLEVNPNWINGSITDTLNVIDARWIDTDSGLFIDITTLRPNLTAQEEGHEGYMMCKDKHHYNHSDIFPLRESTFEDIPVKIPYAYTDLLIEEYSHEALAVRDFENHHFDQLTMEWKPISTTSGGKKAPKMSSKDHGFHLPKGISKAALARLYAGRTPGESDVGKPPPPAEEVNTASIIV
ncbi:hypothetical protein AAFC00_007271 [Neodothiora populina]|uniref:LicD/FKTN/FKRP nucleotidyltransferase domain-containing protein n=1 Tax=Neodothiora populina TaxID=2781224 RepID=A0ABR3PI36_9PEZI